MKPEEILNKMSPEVRAQTAAKAKAEGLSVLEFVSQRISAELNDNDLDGVDGGGVKRVDLSSVEFD